ncbi:hypothetical protein D3C79_1004840 [compost metagenome]
MYRRVHVFFAAGGNVGQALAGGGVDRGESLPRLRRAALAVDHGLVGKPQGSGLALPILKLEHVQMLQRTFLCIG